MIKKIGLLTAGGDCQGLNAAIRGVVKAAVRDNIEVYGYIEGFKGLLDNNYKKLDLAAISGILQLGGTILTSSNKTNTFAVPVEENGQIVYKDMSDKCIENMNELGIEALVVIGGDSSHKSTRDYMRKGVNVVGIPKTIDNDVPCTEATFGYDTAVSIAVDALDRLHTTAASHGRIQVLEVMGRNAGWIALESGISGGADVILLPEIDFDLKKVVGKIQERKQRGKNFSIVVISEGAKPMGGENNIIDTIDNPGLINIKLGGIGEVVARQLEEMTGMEARSTTLGHIQRGGAPTAYDRMLATKYGVYAMELVKAGDFGKMVTVKNSKISSCLLDDVVGKDTITGAVSSQSRTIQMDDELINVARKVGICLGD